MTRPSCTIRMVLVMEHPLRWIRPVQVQPLTLTASPTWRKTVPGGSAAPDRLVHQEHRRGRRGDIANDARTVKVYIAPEASIRSYFTVVAVPDDVDTYEFLRDNGWFELANAKGEGLFVLDPARGAGLCPG